MQLKNHRPLQAILAVASNETCFLFVVSKAKKLCEVVAAVMVNGHDFFRFLIFSRRGVGSWLSRSQGHGQAVSAQCTVVQ